MPWTEAARREHDRRRPRYASDLSDRECALIAPLLPPASRLGRPRKTDLREVVNAILYMASTGCQWRMLPSDLPPSALSRGADMPAQNDGPEDRGPREPAPKREHPEIDALLRQGRERLGGMLPGGPPPPRGIFVTGAIALAVFGAWSSYYTVPSDSVAVVQRFGKYSAEVSPGLHFKVPFGIDVATLVPVKRQLKQEFGFSTPGASDPFQSPTDGRRETEMVTGDLNAALVEWVVQYRISEPLKFLFEVREPGATLRYVSESVMREVVGDRTVDEVITIGRQEIESEALLKMQALTTKYAMGISIDQVQLKNINPPGPVQASFNEVNQAQQEKERLINEARREYNKIIPLAEGEKDQRIREADGYRLKRINEAEGDAARFTALLAEYEKAPEVTRRRIYIETLQAVLPGVRSKIIVDGSTASILPLLNLNRQQEDRP